MNCMKKVLICVAFALGLVSMGSICAQTPQNPEKKTEKKVEKCDHQGEKAECTHELQKEKKDCPAEKKECDQTLKKESNKPAQENKEKK